MSWSVSYTNRENFSNDVREFQSCVDTTEAVEQLDTARKAAIAIMESGAVGVKDGDYVISLNGHANPEHRPRSGYANDCVSVHVSQKTN